MRTLAAVLVVVALTNLASCSKVGQDPIVGKWQKVVGNGGMEFFPDGTIIIREDPASLSGKWQRLDDGRLKVEATVFGITVAEVYRVEIRGDEATFTASNGEVDQYRRAQQ